VRIDTHYMRQFRQGLLLLCLLVQTGIGLSADQAITHVTTTPLGSQIFYPRFSAPATALSLNESRISAEISGRIVSLEVRVGDRIARKEPLAELDCRSNQIRLRQAQAALQATQARVNLAERQFQRSQSLRKAKSISEELYNQREADVATSRADRQAQQASIEEAQLNIERCTLRTPFDAIVLERLASEGEWINPGQAVVRLLDSQQLEISAQIPVDQADSLAGASHIMFEESHGEYPLQLRELLPVIEPRSRNQEARLLFSERLALPGSSGRINWQSAAPHLPADLPVRRGDQIGLFIANAGKAQFVPLPGALEGRPAATELPPETEIIIEGRLGLNDGDPIQIAPIEVAE